MRPHTSGVHAVARRCRRHGANVDVERTIPELAAWDESGTCTDAILDVVCWWPGRLHQHLLDITIRCPHAARYNVSEDVTGRAAKEKHRRYGEQVWPVALTTYGRLGAEGMQILELLAAEARAASCGLLTQRFTVAQYRSDLERAVLHATADQCFLALGAGSGSRASAPRRVQADTLDAAIGSHSLTDEQRRLITAKQAATAVRRQATHAVQHASPPCAVGVGATRASLSDV